MTGMWLIFFMEIVIQWNLEDNAFGEVMLQIDLFKVDDDVKCKELP